MGNGWGVFKKICATSFNYDTKTISFYKTQVDEINKLTDIPISEKEEEEEEPPKPNPSSSSSNSGMIALWVILGIAILAVIGVVIGCFCK